MKKLSLLIFLMLIMPNFISAKVINGRDVELVTSDVNYIKTTNINGVAIHEEVTEEEYNSVLNESNPLITPFNYAETSYKKLIIRIFDWEDGIYFGELELQWKIIPHVRSYDVIAFRGQGIEVMANSQMGNQNYWRNDVKNTISYAYNGTNINVKELGYGISMNLVNGMDINGYNLYTSCFLEKTATGRAYVYGSYQHATEDVTLAESQNYDISAAGLGNTIYFYGNTVTKYDNMPGVYVTIN